MTAKRPYGSGSVRAYKDGYRITWRDNAGAKRSRVLRPSTKREAEALLRAIQTDVERGTYIEPQKPEKEAPKALPELEEEPLIVTFGDLWEEYLKIREPELAASTMDNLRSLARSPLNALLPRDLAEIDQRLIERWWAAQSGHKVTRRTAYFQIRKAFRLAARWEIIPAIPFEIENAGRDETRKRPDWTIQDVDAVLLHLPAFYKAPVEVMLSGHLRISELIALDTSDYRDGWISVTKQIRPAGKVQDTKTGQHKKIQLLERGKVAMEACPHRIGKAPLFPGERGERMTHHALRSAWNKAVEASGREDFHLHDLRHVGLSLVSEVAPLVVVQQRAGHASRQSTLRYLHADERQHAEAVQRVNAVLQRLG